MSDGLEEGNWNPRRTVKGSSEGIESDDDDDTGDPASQGSANSCLGFDSRTRERSSGRVGREESADGVGNADGN